MGSPQPGTEACRSCGASNSRGGPILRIVWGQPRRHAALSPVRRRESRRPAVLQLVRSGLSGGVAPDEGPLGATQAGLDGERKQVTVLFADVKGSMDMAEQVDPEEWREIMQRFFSLLSEGVRRFEGTVDKFTGDGIMALFGAPIAHEDHAPRACFAALRIGELVSEYAAELRRSRGMSFSVRIGINSGEVVAGAIGEDSEPEYTAVGHTVGLAQRMEALAEPGKAYLTEHAAKLAEGYLELKDLGEFEVKGEPADAGLRAARYGLGALATRPLPRARPLTIRSEEMKMLEERSSAPSRDVRRGDRDRRRSRCGQSRLCHEFAERLERRGSTSMRHRHRHMEAIPFLPVLQMMRGYFGIEDRDSERVARRRSPAGCCCSTPTSPTTSRWSSTSWCPIPIAPRPR